MNQKQIPPSLEVNCCLFKHKDLCPRKWIAKFINHEIVCRCQCHREMVLGRVERLPNTINLLSRSGKEDEL